MIPIAYITEWQVRYPFTIQSRWVQGTAEIVSFSLDELLGTKLRALYQRRKGRDLFDLDYALRYSDAMPDRIIGAFIQYIGRQGLRITAGQFRGNLRTKLTDQQFGMDIMPLLRSGISFDAKEAVERIETKLIRLLDQALVDIEVIP